MKALCTTHDNRGKGRGGKSYKKSKNFCVWVCVGLWHTRGVCEWEMALKYIEVHSYEHDNHCYMFWLYCVTHEDNFLEIYVGLGFGFEKVLLGFVYIMIPSVLGWGVVKK